MPRVSKKYSNNLAICILEWFRSFVMSLLIISYKLGSDNDHIELLNVVLTNYLMQIFWNNFNFNVLVSQ